MKIKQFVLTLCTAGAITSAQADCTIYSQAYYNGYRTIIHNGTELPQLFQDWNDKISSIKVSSDSVLYAWEHANYQGKAYTFRQNTGVVTPQLDKANDISSLKCMSVASAPSVELIIPPARAEADMYQKPSRVKFDKPIQIAARPPVSTTPANNTANENHDYEARDKPIDRLLPPHRTALEQICKSGYVKRNAYGGDQVCVTPAIQAQTQQENQAARMLTKADGTCTSPIFVWRLAAEIDKTCASQSAHLQAIDDNNHAAERWQ
ncbi:MAG: hypothetical protein HOP20_10715 [Sulfuriferula sp.]|nr:hypothetical protein [Sulfuriferula sp.]